MVSALAIQYMPILHEQVQQYWADAPSVAYLAGQVEQESNWKPNAHLHTSREDGYGLAQFTVTPKFNSIQEMKDKYPDLFGGWKDNYNVTYQLRALTVYMRDLNHQVKGAADEDNRYAFTLSAYNGGMGGVNKDRVLCKATAGCDQSKWWGNVEHTSLKSKVAVKGYGQSFFQVNRGYVTNVMKIRFKKYEGL